MILHLVRHPPPDIDDGVCYGQQDVPLLHPPQQAASRLLPLLPDTPSVWSSPLQRCRLLAQCLYPAARLDARLAEIHFGQWEGQTWDAIGKEALEQWAANVEDFVPPGGESPRALQARVLDWVREVEATGIEDVVAFTHAGVIRVLLAHWQGLPPEEWHHLTFDYGTVTRVVVTAHGGQLLSSNR